MTRSSQASVLFGIPWSLGGVLDVDGQQKFDKFYRDLLLCVDEELPMPKAMGNKLEIPYPENGLVYDYAYEVWRGKAVSWFGKWFCVTR